MKKIFFSLAFILTIPFAVNAADSDAWKIFREKVTAQKDYESQGLPPINASLGNFNKLVASIAALTDEDVRKTSDVWFREGLAKPNAYFGNVPPETAFAILWKLGDTQSAVAMVNARRIGLNSLWAIWKKGVPGLPLKYDRERIEDFYLNGKGILDLVLDKDVKLGAANIELIGKNFIEGSNPATKEEWAVFLEGLVKGRSPYELMYSKSISADALRREIKRNPLVTPERLNELAALIPRLEPDAPAVFREYLLSFGNYNFKEKCVWDNPDPSAWNAGLTALMSGIAKILQKDTASFVLEDLGKFALETSIPSGIKRDEQLFCLMYALSPVTYWKFMEDNAEKLVGKKILPDTDAPLFMNADLSPFFSTPDGFRLYLSFVSRLKPQSLTLRRALFNNLDKPPLGPSENAWPLASGETIGNQVLDFVIDYYTGLKNEKIFYSDALWSFMVFPKQTPEAPQLKKWAQFLSKNAAMLDYASFKQPEAIAYFCDNLWNRPYSKQSDDYSSLLFDQLYLSTYIQKATESGFIEGTLTETLKKRSPEFLTGLSEYFFSQLDQIAADRTIDYQGRYKRFQFMIRISDGNPTVYPRLIQKLFAEYRSFNPTSADASVSETVTVEKKFFRYSRDSSATVLDYGKDKDAEALLAETIKKSLSRVKYLNGAGTAGFDQSFKTILTYFKKQDEPTITALKLVEIKKMPVLRAFEFVTSLMDDEFSIKKIRVEYLDQKNLGALVDIADGIRGDTLQAFLKEKAALDLNMDSAKRIEERERMYKVLDGVSLMFYMVMRAEDVQNLVKAVGIIDSKSDAAPAAGQVSLPGSTAPAAGISLTKKMVQTIVRIIFYHPDQKESSAISTVFLDSFSNGILGANDPELMSEYARVFFFRNRENKTALKAQFSKLLDQFKGRMAASDGSSNARELVSAMLVFAEDADVLSFIKERLKGDKTLLGFLGMDQKELVFVYKVYGAGELLKRIGTSDFTTKIGNDFMGYRESLKTIFELNFNTLLAGSKDIKEIELDLALRSIVYSAYSGAGTISDFKNYTKEELEQAIFSFFVNEKEIAKGEFQGFSLFYFPKPEQKYSTDPRFQPSVWEQQVAKLKVGKDGELYDFLVKGFEYYLGASTRPTTQTVASAIVYMNHAIYLKTRELMEAVQRKDINAERIAWDEIENKLLGPFFSGDLFPQTENQTVDSYLAYKNVHFSDSRSDDNGLYFLFQNIYGNWTRQTVPSAVYTKITKHLADFIGSRIDTGTRNVGQNIRFLAEFIKQAQGFFDLASLAKTIYPQTAAFIADPLNPFYYYALFNGITFNVNINGTGTALYEALRSWYSWNDGNNPRYFELMPGFRFNGEADSTVEANNPGVLNASWGYYSHILDNKYRVTGPEPSSLTWVENGFRSLPQGLNNGYALSEKSEGTSYVRVEKVTTSKVTYKLNIKNNDGTKSEEKIISLGAKTGLNQAATAGMYFFSKDAVWPHLTTNVNMIALNGIKDDPNPDDIILFSNDTWLPIRLSRFNFDGFTSVPHLFVLGGTLPDIDQAYAFSGNSTLGIRGDPLFLEAKGVSYVALIDKPNFENLIYLQKNGRTVYLAIKPATEETGPTSIHAITVSAEGSNAIRFDFKDPKVKLPAAGRFSFTVCMSSSSWDIGDYLVIASDDKKISRDSFYTIDSIQTVFEFNSLPDKTEQVVLLKKSGTVENFSGFIGPKSVDMKTGRLSTGFVYLNPAATEKNMKDLTEREKDSMWVLYSVDDRNVLFTSESNRYDVLPNFGFRIATLLANWEHKIDDGATKLKTVINEWKTQTSPGRP